MARIVEALWVTLVDKEVLDSHSVGVIRRMPRSAPNSYVSAIRSARMVAYSWRCSRGSWARYYEVAVALTTPPRFLSSDASTESTIAEAITLTTRAAIHARWEKSLLASLCQMEREPKYSFQIS